MKAKNVEKTGSLELEQILAEEFAVLHGLVPEETGSSEPPSAEDRLSALYNRIHNLPQKRSALCLSGGGIRSATFSLGVIQSLARHNLLGGFDYLSTVSGGGYVGGWLSAWIHRHSKGLAGVIDEIAKADKSKLEPEPDAVQHLRAFSNYLSPKLGFFSADSWTLAATYLRNLLLNWLVFVPLFTAVLIIPRFYAAGVLRPDAAPADMAYLLWTGLAALLGAMSFIGSNRPSRGFFRADQAQFLAFCLIPLLSSAVLLTISWAWYRTRGGGFYSLGVFLIVALALKVICWIGSKPRWKQLTTYYDLLAVCLAGVLEAALVWFACVHLFPDPWQAPLRYACFAVPLFLALFLVSEAILIGISSYIAEDQDLEWGARMGAWLLLALLLWILIFFLVIYAPAGFLLLGAKAKTLIAALGGLSGIAAVFGGRSPRTRAEDSTGDRSDRSAMLLTTLSALAAPAFALVLASALSLGTSWMLYRISGHITSFDHLVLIRQTGVEHLLVTFVLMGIVGLVMGMLININKFSLHSMYRNRLIRAYLGASREESDRKPNPFTGFDPDDNIYINRLRAALFTTASFKDVTRLLSRIQQAPEPLSEELRRHIPVELFNRAEAHAASELERETLRKDLAGVLNRLLADLNLAEHFSLPDSVRQDGIGDFLRQKEPGPEIRTLINRAILDAAYSDHTHPKARGAPFHVINIALNLVRGENLAWQQRKAESFAVTPLHCGNHRLGYRRSSQYGGPSGISLGTAVAISGAAASPNMGYHSSPAVTFLMAFFNARLGWWLGNPGKAGDRTFRRRGPVFSVWPLVSEALGLTNDRSRFVYLSDGGHFENLGIYEMILRRCRFILAVDGSQDPKASFEDLGNAIRKIRVDLGVPIMFYELPIRSRYKRKGGEYFAVGKIRYSQMGKDEKDGTILYLKPAFYGSEPRDVFSYAQANPAFPHESTADQWFSESQFESYRMLGYFEMSHVLRQLCGRDFTGGFEAFVKAVDEYLEAGAGGRGPGARGRGSGVGGQGLA